MFRFKVTTKDLNGLKPKLQDIEKKMSAPQNILADIGRYMIGSFTKRFDAEGPGWRPSRKKQIEGGKTLSGKQRLLLKSHSFQVIGNAVVIGTNKIYARIHQLGGVISGKSGGYLRFRYKGVIKGQRGARVGYTWAMVKQVTIPARPWAFFDEKDIAIAQQITGRTIMGGK